MSDNKFANAADFLQLSLNREILLACSQPARQLLSPLASNIFLGLIDHVGDSKKQYLQVEMMGKLENEIDSVTQQELSEISVILSYYGQRAFIQCFCAYWDLIRELETAGTNDMIGIKALYIRITFIFTK